MSSCLHPRTLTKDDDYEKITKQGYITEAFQVSSKRRENKEKNSGQKTDQSKIVSVLHQDEGGIGKSIPDAGEIS